MTAQNRNGQDREEILLTNVGSPALADELDWGDPVIDAAAAANLPSGPELVPGLMPAADSAGQAKAAPGTEPAVLAPLEWESGGSKPGAAAKSPGTTAAGSSSPSSQPVDFVSHRIRERYFRARFPEVEPPTPANADPGLIIKAARLYFEDGDIERAAELLQVAAEMLPGEDRLLLAKLEIHFLARDAARFASAARQFEQRFPGSPNLPRIRRFGELLHAAAEAASSSAPLADDRYGAWPEIANWIEAPWDLTNEVLAVELRSRLLAMPITSDTMGAP